MYTIEKTFTGDLAHRIHTQRLDENFTEGNSKVLKCRRLHGHTFSLKVKLGSEVLENNMVLDYNELGFVKDMISDILDHRTLVADTDPILRKILIPAFSEYKSVADRADLVALTKETRWKCSRFNTDVVGDQDIKEFLDSFVIVPFTTSSENIAKWIFGIVDAKVQEFNRAHCTSVQTVSVSYKETPNSEAIFTA